MTAFDAAHEAAPVEKLDARWCMNARVTTTVMLPPEALTLVAPPPEMISQLNVEHVLGIPSRIYLELLRERGCPIAVTCVGKLRLVDRNEFRSWLSARGKVKRATTTTENNARNAEDPDTVDELDRLGFKPVPSAEGR
jgi:hypothetical protein